MINFVLANSADPDEMPHYGSSLFANVPVKGFPIYKWLGQNQGACDVTFILAGIYGREKWYMLFHYLLTILNKTNSADCVPTVEGFSVSK